MLPILAVKNRSHRIPKQPLQLARSAIERRRKSPISLKDEKKVKDNVKVTERRMSEKIFLAIRKYFQNCASRARNPWQRIRRFLNDMVGRHFADRIAWKILRLLEKKEILRQGEQGFLVIGTFPETFSAIPA